MHGDNETTGVAEQSDYLGRIRDGIDEAGKEEVKINYIYCACVSSYNIIFL